MHPIPLFRAAALRPLLDYVARTDGSAAELFGRRLRAFEDAEAVLPLATGGAAFEVAARAFDAPDLGLRVGEGIRLERIGELGRRLRTARTLGEALVTAVRSGTRCNTGQRYCLVERGEVVLLHRTFTRALVRGRQQVSDFVLAFTLNLVRLAAGATWRPAELHFEGPPPAHAERLAALGSGRVHFESPSSAIAIPRELLALPLPSAPASLARNPVNAALPSNAAASLRQAVEALARMGELESRAVAEAAGMSVRSLQRHLQRDGLKLAHLVAEARRHAAMRLLADDRLKVVEISAALGYTDSANFTRAFRRWAGLSPQEFRRARTVGAAAAAVLGA